MIYLSGAVRELPPHLGFILTPNMGNRVPEGAPWAADNGCFTQGGNFRLDKYLGWLKERASAADRCLFATAPDVVGDADATWQRSLPVFPLIRALGYKAALCAQDGIECMEIDWDAFDVLFLGGSTKWKLSGHAEAVAREARAHGKWVHMGRVNSKERVDWAAWIGCDSVDGTYLAFGPDRNLPKLLEWMKGLNVNPFLPFHPANEVA